MKDFDENQRRVILNLAREAIRIHLDSGEEMAAPAGDEFLFLPCAAFVTLKIQDELRGCIGSTDPSRPVGETIVRCAIGAGFRDPRFPPLRKEEFPAVHIEVSILSPFREIHSLEEITVGIHGIQVSFGYLRGLLLPQVATEQEWDRDTFVRYCCRKAGLPSDAWQKPGVKLEIFSAEVFGE